MRIPINLASEPFRRDRAQLAVSGIVGVVLAGLLVVMVFLILAERGRLKETRVAVENLNSELRSITSEQAQVDATLRQTANAEVLQRSLMLNALIERKSISWAKIFADLESVLPNDVRVVQIRLPQINSRNEVSLDMDVGAKDPAPVIEFIKTLENSPLFGPVTNSRETPPTQSEPLYRFRITVNYAQKL